MPLAPAVRCRRSTQRQPSAPQVAAKLLDLATCRTIEAQQPRRIGFCRCLSYQKGPLETRRLLGKRHMTGLIAEPPTYSRSWHFDVINDPTEWHWEPPTAPETRRKNNAEISLKNLSGKVLRWLEDSDLDKPYLNPPSEVLDKPAVLDTPTVIDSPAVTDSPAVLDSSAVLDSPVVTDSPAITKSQAVAESPVVTDSQAITESPTAEQPITVPSADPVTVHRELYQLRSAIGGMKKVTKTSTWPVRDQFIKNLVSRIRSRDIPVEDLVETMRPLDEATIAHISNGIISHSVISKIRNAVVTTLSELRAEDLRDDYREPWVAILNDSFAATANGTGFRTLALIIEKAQPMDRNMIPVDELATGLYHLMRSMVLSPKKSVEDLAQLAQMMQLFEPSMREAVGQKVESIVAETFDAGLSYEYRYWWMLFKAHYIDATFSEFEQLVISYLGSDKRPNDHQHLLLISARMFADACMDAESYMSFTRQLRQDYLEKHWLTLAEKVIDSRGRVGLTSLWCHLGALKWDVRFFETLIVLARSHRPTIRQDTARVIKAIVSNPLLPSLRFWLALKDEKNRIMPPEATSTEDSAMPDDALATKKELMQLTDKIAGWYENASALTNRMAFRGVSRCIRFQTELSGRPSEKVLRSMTNIVTASLRKGQPAPVKRLQHYLANIVAPNLGVQVARDCSIVLASWQNQVSLDLEAVIKGKRRQF